MVLKSTPTRHLVGVRKKIPVSKPKTYLYEKTVLINLYKYFLRLYTIVFGVAARKLTQPYLPQKMA